MNEKVKKLWIKALRSGEFKQGRGVLRDADDNFCCLGVLCELYRRETGNGEWISGGEFRIYTEVTKCFLFLDDLQAHTCALPPRVVAWAGLKDKVATFKKEPLSSFGSSLLKENDNGASFRQIADIIEQKF